MVCFRADAATPYSRASLKFLPSSIPQITPPAKESPPPTRSTMGWMLYSLEFNEESAKRDAKGNLKAIYLKEEIGGFAVHLVQK